MTLFLVEQIGAKNNQNAAACDEELKFGTVIEARGHEKQNWL